MAGDGAEPQQARCRLVTNGCDGAGVGAGPADERAGPRSATPVSSGQRAVAASVLRDGAAMDARTLVAVVDAAAWWVDQDAGAAYAAALLAAVTDERTAGDTLAVLLTPDLLAGVPHGVRPG